MSTDREVRRLNFFERYLTLRVVLCVAVGVALRKTLPAWISAPRRLATRAGTLLDFAPVRILTTNNTRPIV